MKITNKKLRKIRDSIDEYLSSIENEDKYDTDVDDNCGKLNRKHAPLPVKMKPFDKVREHV
jgi:hypothetical protein